MAIWHGDFAGAYSLAHVNRELASRIGVRRAAPLFGTASVSESDLAEDDESVVRITHGWPPALRRPGLGPWIVFQPWEYGSMPRSWLAPFKDEAAEVWTYSEWNRARYVADGLDPERTITIPLGVDATRFRPDAPPLPEIRAKTDRSVRFLFVGGTIRRKGIDVLLAAWRKAFRADDDVALVIKDFCKKGAYRGQTQEAAIDEVARDPDAARIVYVDDDLPAESLPGLYAACDVLVHPYRGEGFGLPVLEALACGLPTIVTKGGACDDFCTPEDTLFIAAGKSPVRPAEPLVGEGFLLEPSVDQLVGMLRLAAAHRSRLREMGLRAAARVARDWTWERGAAIATARLLKYEAPIRAGR